MADYTLRIWQTDKGTWKVSKTVVTPEGRELTSNTTKEARGAFEVAQAFIEGAKSKTLGSDLRSALLKDTPKT